MLHDPTAPVSIPHILGVLATRTDPHVRLVLLELANAADVTGEPPSPVLRPTQQALMDATGLGERVVQRALKKARDDKLIEVAEPAAPGRPAGYRLLVEPVHARLPRRASGTQRPSPQTPVSSDARLPGRRRPSPESGVDPAVPSSVVPGPPGPSEPLAASGDEVAEGKLFDVAQDPAVVAKREAGERQRQAVALACELPALREANGLDTLISEQALTAQIKRALAAGWSLDRVREVASASPATSLAAWEVTANLTAVQKRQRRKANPRQITNDIDYTWRPPPQG